MKLAFLIGPTDIGGGTYVIYQHALFAQKQGHNVTLIHTLPKTVNPWHEALTELCFIAFEDYELEIFDLVFATWWSTVYCLSSIQSVRYAYFVQSIESWFSALDDFRTRRMVEATYTAPLPVVTEAAWIKQYLEKEYGRKCWLAPNGIRKDYLSVVGAACAERVPGRLRVLVEGPIGVDFKNVARTIRLAKRAGSDEIWWLTSDDMLWYPGVDRVFSRIPASRVGSIYCSCDVLLKLSYVEGMFGPPLEMFHCGGTAVVYDVTGHDEYIQDGVNALVVPTDDEEGVLWALDQLKRSPALLKSLQAGALERARDWPCWDAASTRFMECVERLCASPPCTAQDIELALVAFRPLFEEQPNPSYTDRLKEYLLDAIRAFPECKRLVAPPVYWLADRLRRRSPRRDKRRCF